MRPFADEQANVRLIVELVAGGELADLVVSGEQVVVNTRVANALRRDAYLPGVGKAGHGDGIGHLLRVGIVGTMTGLFEPSSS